VGQITKPQFSILRHKPENQSKWFRGQTTRAVATGFEAKSRETVDLGFEAKPRNPRSSSPCARCRPHTTSSDLSIMRPSSIRHVLDDPWSSALSLLLLPQSSSLPAMPHMSPTHHETRKHVSPHKTDSRVRLSNFPDSNSNQGKSITHHKPNQGPLGFSIFPLMRTLTTQRHKV
jgi:hypothetical protein